MDLHYLCRSSQIPHHNNYNQYPYLKKIFDSDEFGFKKLKIKVFEIDYEKFN